MQWFPMTMNQGQKLPWHQYGPSVKILDFLVRNQRTCSILQDRAKKF